MRMFITMNQDIKAIKEHQKVIYTILDTLILLNMPMLNMLWFNKLENLIRDLKILLEIILELKDKPLSINPKNG
jgi:hypothetical protein